MTLGISFIHLTVYLLAASNTGLQPGIKAEELNRAHLSSSYMLLC